MQTPIDNVPKGDDSVSPWYRSAITTAVVAAIFSLIVLLLVVGNYVRTRVADAKTELQLEELKIVARGEPDNEQLLARIRQLDLEYRRRMIRRVDFSRTGDYLLLGGVVVFLIAVKWANTFRRKSPVPGRRPDQVQTQLQRAVQSRWAVAAAVVVLTGGAAFLVSKPKIDFAAADSAATPYPSTEEISENWPRFRGPGGLGVSAYINIPTKWDGKTGEGVLWKTKVPLPGHNSPVIWGDRVFLSGADPNERQVYCFDAVSGKVLWTGNVPTRPSPEAEEFEVMPDTGYAAPTVATDGRRVYAIFVTGDVGCFDFNGRRVWNKSFGIPDNAYGYASSLAMYQNLLLIQYDQADIEDDKSRLFAFDGFSGNLVWEAKRPVANAWTSPIVAKVGEQYQIMTVGDPWTLAYDPTNGAEIWRAECVSGDLAPSPIYAGGLVFALEPYSRVVAVKADGRGNVTKTHIAWDADESAPSICSPVSDGELLYLLGSEGTLLCCKVADGAKVYEKDLDLGFLASPSLVGDKLYLLSDDGVMLIAKAGAEYEELARCELGEDCQASPAFADGRIYIRSLENLYCIGETP
ncbi:MAG: PQQ-binding-like beta-propeller repeat protein [Phycisphaerales bacterium]|nr:MAG: PQQ-binding-like beta-propeller repeat protein [Phycisphaerales bacterium]